MPSSLRLLLWDLALIAAPDTLHTLDAHVPASLALRVRYPSIAIAGVLPGQGDNASGQGSFVICPALLLRLCRSILPQHTADPPLRHRHHTPDMIDNRLRRAGHRSLVVLALGARAASRRISLSRVRPMPPEVTERSLFLALSFNAPDQSSSQLPIIALAFIEKGYYQIEIQPNP